MTTQKICVHHWMLETPNGKNGFSNGKCIKCKAEKEFNNINETTFSMWTTNKQRAKERS